MRGRVSCNTWVDVKSACVAVALSLSLSFFSHGTRTGHSSAVSLVRTSMSCDISICSASSSMNYGSTLQPLNYGDQPALGFLRAPAGVVGSV